jgi:hypothetical protein
MMTLGLSDAALSDSARSEGARSEGAISEGIVMRLEWMDGTLPYGLLALTLRVADRIENAEGVLGRGMLAGEICAIKVSTNPIPPRENLPISWRLSYALTRGMAPLEYLPK